MPCKEVLIPTEQHHGLDRRSSLGYQINHLARLLAQSLREKIEPHGVVPGQFAQLLALFEKDGLTQSELCERVQIDQSTMAHTLKRMERDGLIRRLSDPKDRRRAFITLTPRARSLEPRLVNAARDVNAAALAGLDSADADALMIVIARLISNLEPTPTLSEAN